MLTGSHVDTQPSGGKFDGNYGVLAGLEVLRTLNDAKIATEKPVGVAIWTNEEGSRFVPVMGGSGAFAGVFTLEHLLAAARRRRRLVRRRARAHRLCGQRAGRRTRARRVLRGAHRAGARSRARGQDRRRGDRRARALRWYDCVWTGQDAHAGPTPMEARHDALRGAARMVEAVNALALRHAPDGRATVGFMQVSPNSRNVIPGLVKMTVDLRHPRRRAISRRWTASFATRRRRSPRELRLECDLQQVDHFPASRFDPGCVDAVRAATRALGLSAPRDGQRRRATMRSMSRASPRRR